MPNTPVWSLPYPALTHAPNVPYDIQSLATALEGKLQVRVVTATTDVTVPYLGQVVFSTTDNLLYRYNGSAWTGAVACGGGNSATRHEARYWKSGAVQTVAASTATAITFDANEYDCTDVAYSAGTFTLNRAGLWALDGGVRGNAATATNSCERLLRIVGPGTTVLAWSGISASPMAGAHTAFLSCHTQRRFAAGDTVRLEFSHLSTGSMDINNERATYMALTWLRP